LRIIPAAIFVPLAVVLTIAPFLEPEGSIDLGENGLSGIMDHKEQIENMSNPVARFAYSFGDKSCHQNSSRSFFVHGNQMPMCSRCMSIYWGFAAGSLIALVRRIEVPLSYIILSLVPMGVDGLAQAFTPYESTNLIRPLTGFPPSLLLAMVLVYSFQEVAFTPPRPSEMSPEEKNTLLPK
ncbi:MAG: DUF2085 domain-containing protein, partial [Thermoplasmata archaeon]|nr:DUF2085 domain-containing protein [Thermoplasmata archaeon]